MNRETLSQKSQLSAEFFLPASQENINWIKKTQNLSRLGKKSVIKLAITSNERATKIGKLSRQSFPTLPDGV